MGRKRRAVLDLRIPFFRPIWRRIALIGVLGIWTVVEATAGSEWWALLAGGLMIYGIREFFIASNPEDFEDRGEG